MEVALSALRFASDHDVIISLASDGRDNTEFAGGICDIITKRKAIQFGLDPRDFLDRNDSYNFFVKTGITKSLISCLLSPFLIEPGPAGVMVFLKGELF